MRTILKVYYIFEETIVELEKENKTLQIWKWKAGTIEQNDFAEFSFCSKNLELYMKKVMFRTTRDHCCIKNLIVNKGMEHWKQALIKMKKRQLIKKIHGSQGHSVVQFIYTMKGTQTHMRAARCLVCFLNSTRSFGAFQVAAVNENFVPKPVRSTSRTRWSLLV